MLSNQPGGCRFYAELINVDHEEVEKYCRANLPTAEEFVRYCDSKNVCPHEMMKEMVSSATVVAAPYAYFFVPFIRHSLLDWMGVRLDELIVIIDEAHNIPDYTREIESFELSRALLDMVQKEVDEYGDPEILQGVSIMDMVIELRKLLQAAVDEYLIEEDGLIPPSFLEEGLMSAFTASSRAIEIAAKALMEHGEIVREQRIEQNRLPRSYIFSMGAFLEQLVRHRRLDLCETDRGRRKPILQGLLSGPDRDHIGPAGMRGNDPHVRDTIAVGGVPGFDRPPFRDGHAGVPFPIPEREPGGLLHGERHHQVRGDVPGRRDHPEHGGDRGPACATWSRRTRSSSFLRTRLMERFLADTDPDQDQAQGDAGGKRHGPGDLMDVVTRFKGEAETGAVLFSVVGGRISEGIDFPDKELQLAVIIGVPYPKPTAKQRALMHYYERKFHKGWEITVKAPTSRKMLQAIGRLIRTETDIGAAVILDRQGETVHRPDRAAG